MKATSSSGSREAACFQKCRCSRAPLTSEHTCLLAYELPAKSTCHQIKFVARRGLVILLLLCQLVVLLDSCQFLILVKPLSDLPIMGCRITGFFIIVCAIVMMFLVWYSFLLQKRQVRNPYMYDESDTIHVSQDGDPFIPRSAPEPPTILLATQWFNLQWFPLNGEVLSCPAHIAAGSNTSNLMLYSCEVTSDIRLFYKSAAVVFHARGENLHSSVKKLASFQRPVNQRWVMYIMESPLNVPAQWLKYLDQYGPVNWTATYMKNSDVQSAYYDIVPGVFHGGFDPKRNYLAGRTGMAAILISNCGVSKRMTWIKKIKQYIDVQVYGGCGSRCSKSGCMSKLKKHKFYLSFENSYCRDYITEKVVSNAFKNEIVPVVIAYVNFSDTSTIPPGSAINALNFPSVKELTNYMKSVGKNSTLYNEYFRWHSHYTIAKSPIGSRKFLCPLCRHIATNNKAKTYKSVYDWYSEKNMCKNYPAPV